MSNAQDESEAFRLYWDWAFHEDNTMVDRGNFFFVGESMIFAGYAALFAVSGQSEAVARAIPVFCLIGAFIALLWIYVHFIHQQTTMKPLKDILKGDPRYQSIAGKRTYRLRINYVMGYVLPGSLLLTWIILLIISRI